VPAECDGCAGKSLRKRWYVRPFGNGVGVLFGDVFSVSLCHAVAVFPLAGLFMERFVKTLANGETASLVQSLAPSICSTLAAAAAAAAQPNTLVALAKRKADPSTSHPCSDLDSPDPEHVSDGFSSVKRRKTTDGFTWCLSQTNHPHTSTLEQSHV
jgi:hypothetical protein